nr:MAG TPA: hypothetical protein [Caudoviricetes sp.]
MYTPTLDRSWCFIFYQTKNKPGYHTFLVVNSGGV